MLRYVELAISDAIFMFALGFFFQWIFIYIVFSADIISCRRFTESQGLTPNSGKKKLPCDWKKPTGSYGGTLLLLKAGWLKKGEGEGKGTDRAANTIIYQERKR